MDGVEREYVLSVRDLLEIFLSTNHSEVLWPVGLAPSRLLGVLWVLCFFLGEFPSEV